MSDKRGNGPTYNYDPTGRLTKRTWSRGIETDYTYNPLSQLTTITYSDLDTPDVAFTYNRMGQQTTVTDATGTRGFAYDSNLQQVQETNWQATIERTFDTLGHPTAITLGTNYTVNYTYDPCSRLSSVAQFTYTYLPHSDLIASVNNGPLQTTTTYEPHRNLKTSISNTFNGTLISSFDYTYDAIGRRTERLDSNTITNEFAYNPRSELVSAQMGTNTYDYAYDPIGNRQKAIANTQSNLYQSNELNQYTNITPTPEALTYDLDGNMLSDGMWHYTWDAENRLISVSSNNTLVIQNQYDYMSRRISKTTAITTNTFIYDNWNLISESSTAHINNNYYIWGLDLSTTLQGAGVVVGLLERVHDDSGSLSDTYDANGNVTDILATNGIIVAHYKYDAFGNTIAKSGTHADGNPFRFSTKYWDEETEFYGCRYSFYSPQFGRLLNRAKISPQGKDNLYSFAMYAAEIVKNRPTNGLPLQGEESGSDILFNAPKSWKHNYSLSESYHGESRCNFETGEVEVSISKETCAGDCVQAHENIHKMQLSDCCKRVKDHCLADPAQCDSYKQMYAGWIGENRDKMECSAYTETVGCAMGAFTSAEDCECKRNMKIFFLGAFSHQKSRCARGGLFDRNKNPCPL